MKKKAKIRYDIENFSLIEWVYIILNGNEAKKKLPHAAAERVEFAFQNLKGKERHVAMFKMYFGEKCTYIEIAHRYGISKSMAYRYVHKLEEIIREDDDIRYILLHTIDQSQEYLARKSALMRNNIWTYEVVSKLKDDKTVFKEICEDTQYKYHRLETYFGCDFTVSEIVLASDKDFQSIKGFGEKTKMMVTVAIWKYYNNILRQERTDG